jgi:hypothetical protein
MALSVISGVWFVVDMSLRGLETSISVQSSRMETLENRIASGHQEIIHEIRVNRARISEVLLEVVRNDGHIMFAQTSMDRIQGQINGLQNSPFDQNPSLNLRIQTEEGRTFVLELPTDTPTDEILDAFMRGDPLNFLLMSVADNLEQGIEIDPSTIERLEEILNQLRTEDPE